MKLSKNNRSLFKWTRMKIPKQMRRLIQSTKQRTTVYTAVFMGGKGFHWQDQIWSSQSPSWLLTIVQATERAWVRMNTLISVPVWIGRLFFYLYSWESAMGISSLYLVHRYLFFFFHRYLVVRTCKVSVPPHSMCLFLQCWYSLPLAWNCLIALSSVSSFLTSVRRNRQMILRGE